MEQQFEPKHVDKFAKGTGPKEMTKEEAKKMKADTLALMQEDIEFMRLKDEYETLQIKAYENGVLLGRIEPSQVPGILGLELVRRDVEAQGWLYNFKKGMEQGMKEESEQMLKDKEGEEVVGKDKASSIITDGQLQ